MIPTRLEMKYRIQHNRISPKWFIDLLLLHIEYMDMDDFHEYHHEPLKVDKICNCDDCNPDLPKLHPSLYDPDYEPSDEMKLYDLITM